MSARFLSGSIDLLNASVIAALLLLVVTHLPTAYESYKIRDSVLAGLERANRAKELVVANALEGKSLGQGWTGSVGEREGISVELHSGVVTVTYPADIDGGGKTLVLVPMYQLEKQIYPLATKVNLKVPLVVANIIWACTSKLTRSSMSFINENLGTLQSKYAPAECRFSYK